MPSQDGEYDVEEGPSRQEEKMESLLLPNPSGTREERSNVRDFTVPSKVELWE